MTKYSLLICFFLAVVGLTRAISYEKCGNGKGLLTIRKLSFNPDPIVLSRSSMRISANIEVHDDVDKDAIIEIKIWKITWVLFGIKTYIRAPCIIGDGNCYKEYCALLNGFNANCMRSKGIYEVEDQTISLPNLSGAARWFASGHFYVEIRVFEKNTQAEQGCYIFTGEIHQ